jgi:hypothetical protein
MSRGLGRHPRSPPPVPWIRCKLRHNRARHPTRKILVLKDLKMTMSAGVAGDEGERSGLDGDRLLDCVHSNKV